MFDFGFSELAMIGAVALVVLGPEKLPIVARTAGQWLGKAQRMVQQVKSDIEREAELSELKKIQEEAKGIADDLSKTVKGQMDAIETDVKAVKAEVDTAGKELAEGFDSAKSAYADIGAPNSAVDDMAGTFDKVGGASFENSGEGSAESVSDFYDWYGKEEPYTPEDDGNRSKTFEKRYKCGPSIDELAEQIERLKAELGDRSPQLGGYNRRLAARARSNRVRIYR